MEEQVLKLLKQLRPCSEGDELLLLLCGTACSRLKGMLKPDVAVEECGDAFPFAAACLAMEWLADMGESANITSLSAGDLTVRREAGCRGKKGRALDLLTPWLKDETFIFRGVKG